MNRGIGPLDKGLRMEQYFNLLQEAKQGIIVSVKAHLDPVSQTMARQCFDHLDAAALFLQQLDHYLATQAKRTEEAANLVAANGKVEVAPAKE